MGKFKNFIVEADESTELYQDILQLIDELSDEEIDSLAAIIYDEFYEGGDEAIEGDGEFSFSKDDLTYMIQEIGPDIYDYIIELLSYDEFENDSDDMEEVEVQEAVSRIMQTKNINRKKRKFMTKSVAQLRKEAPKRKIEMRKTFAARKRYMRANKVKVAAYQKMRAQFIKKGKHHVKLRRRAGTSA